MITKKIKSHQIANIALNIHNSEFKVTFIKKDGTIRVMNCKKNVKQFLKGGTLKYNPVDKGLLPVLDTNLKQYRMINLNTIQSLEYNSLNRIYKVV